MILNDQEYAVTRSQAEAFEAALRNLQHKKGPEYAAVPMVLRRAQAEALRSQLAELRASLDEYAGLRNGSIPVRTPESFEEFLKALVRARIAARISTEELARRLGWTVDRALELERANYSKAVLSEIEAAARDLSVPGLERFVPSQQDRTVLSPEYVFRRLADIGVDLQVIQSRLAPRDAEPRLLEAQEEPSQQATQILRIWSAPRKLNQSE